MVIQDQSAVLAFLESASTHGGAAVERIDTHSAAVFLAGERAWKIKRAVRYDYLDFSTLERRKQCCDAEVVTNRRMAPGLYRGVVPITVGRDGALTLGGDGVVLDWVIEMRRFAQDALFDRLAVDGRLDIELMSRLGAAIAQMHLTAFPRRDCGGYSAMRSVIAGNAATLNTFDPNLIDRVTRDRVIARTRTEFDRVAYRLEQRRMGGLVRQCHGDLHLGNIVLIDGRPTPFDAIEFNDDLACIDIAYDLAFLLMDLCARNLPTHANRLWNAYLRETGDYGSLAELPLFLSCRALVRTKTLLTAATEQPAATRAQEWRAQASEYLALADRVLHPAAPTLLAIGGLSGSGKSSLARRMAPKLGSVLGAVIIRSDEVRRELFGASAPSALPASAYTDDASAQVYDRMCARAARVLASRTSVILDAVFLWEADRERAERTARDAGAAFAGVWLEAPLATRVARVNARQGDASEADARVAERQEHSSTGQIAWPRLDASSETADLDANVLETLPRPVATA